MIAAAAKTTTSTVAAAAAAAPVKGAGGCKTVAGAYFLRRYWGQKPQTLKVMHIMAPRSQNM